MNNTLEDKFIKLSDGRTLGFTEYGDLKGKPVFFFHGNPGSRLTRISDESIAKKLGARIIVPDRPGYGLSDYKSKRHLLEYPRDITELADALGLEQFNVSGISAGGPYVAVCTYMLPLRIKNAAIISGTAPFNRINAYDDLGSDWRMAFEVSKMPEFMLKIFMDINNSFLNINSDEQIKNFASSFSKADAKHIFKPEVISGIKQDIIEATKQGTQGWVREVKIQIDSWGFQLKDIETPIHLWYWEDDPAVPAQMGHYLENNIPNSISHFFPEGGHFSIMDHWQEILENLLK